MPDKPTFNDTIMYYNGRKIYLADVFFDLSQNMPKKSVAAKHGFDNIHWHRIFGQVASFMGIFVMEKKK